MIFGDAADSGHSAEGQVFVPGHDDRRRWPWVYFLLLFPHESQCTYLNKSKQDEGYLTYFVQMPHMSRMDQGLYSHLKLEGSDAPAEINKEFCRMAIGQGKTQEKLAELVNTHWVDGRKLKYTAATVSVQLRRKNPHPETIDRYRRILGMSRLHVKLVTTGLDDARYEEQIKAKLEKLTPEEKYDEAFVHKEGRSFARVMGPREQELRAKSRKQFEAELLESERARCCDQKYKLRALAKTISSLLDEKIGETKMPCLLYQEPSRLLSSLWLHLRTALPVEQIDSIISHTRGLLKLNEIDTTDMERHMNVDHLEQMHLFRRTLASINDVSKRASKRVPDPLGLFPVGSKAKSANESP